VLVSFPPLFWLFFEVGGDREKGLHMEVSGVMNDVARKGDEMEDVETLGERCFTVGELVEYWEGAYVRGERIGFGEPAFVKRVEGKGVYAIKMVGSMRGKFRIVGWKSLFKDGCFNKGVTRGHGARVRGKARLEQMAKVEAEAKLGEELRHSQRELQRAGKKQKELQEHVELRLKLQEKAARKAEKDLTAGHKRQLQQMLEDSGVELRTLIEDEEEKERLSRKSIRDLRREVVSLTEQVGIEKEGQADLEKLLCKANRKRTTLLGSVECWKDKHADLQERTLEREERLRDLKKDMTETAREMKTLEKRLEREDLLNKMEVDELQQQKDELGKLLVERNQDVTIMEEKNIEVCCCPFALPVYCTVTLLTFLQKLRWQHEAKNEQDKATKEVVDRAARKRRKTLKSKQRTVAREADKTRKDASDALTAQQVRRKRRRGNTRQDRRRDDAARQEKARQVTTR